LVRFYVCANPFSLEQLIGACFAFGGTELVGITAGEAKNPRVSVPKAINGTFWRIIFFYLFSIMFIGLLIPANAPEFVMNDETVTNSPFVLALRLAKIPGVVSL
jgi:amino acid transporter